MKKKKLYLIKAGGDLLTLKDSRKRILTSLARLQKKASVVFVHGGGPQIEAELKMKRIPIKYMYGRRVTTPEAMKVVEQVLSGLINKNLSAELNRLHVIAAGISCRDGKLITGKLIPQLGRAAKPVKIDVQLVQTLVSNGFLPVISSVASDSMGEPVNINADDAASAIAVALKADNLIFLTDISGVLNQKRERIPVLKIKQMAALIDAGVITGGMIPKVQSAKNAILKGVGEVDIVNGFEGINLKHGTRILK
jgi:acetylglutamate kinase